MNGMNFIELPLWRTLRRGEFKRGDTKKEMDFEEIVTSVRRIIMFSIKDSVELTLILTSQNNGLCKQ